MKIKKRKTSAILLAEPIVAAVSGLVLYFPLNNPDLAEITWAVGAFLAVNNVALLFSLRREMEEATDELCKTSALCAEYIKVADEDFLDLRDEALGQYMSNLKQLNEGNVVIRGNAYYTWLSNQVKKSHKMVRAVSAWVETAWVQDPREYSFYSENVSAAKRGVAVHRIFITSRERIKLAENRKILLQHIADNLHAHIIWSTEIKDASLKPVADKGFLIIDDRIAFADLEPPAETTGIAMKNSADIKRYERWYDLLKLQAIPATKALLPLCAEMDSDYSKKYGDVLTLERTLDQAKPPDQESLRRELQSWKSAKSDMEFLNKKLL